MCKSDNYERQNGKAYTVLNSAFLQLYIVINMV